MTSMNITQFLISITSRSRRESGEQKQTVLHYTLINAMREQHTAEAPGRSNETGGLIRKDKMTKISFERWER